MTHTTLFIRTAARPARPWLWMLAFVFVLAVAGCAQAPTRQQTLYGQLGGTSGVHAITESMLDAFANDGRVRPFFKHVDINRLSRKFSMFICQLADGPCHYDGASLAEAHRGMNIAPAQFNAVVEDLIKAMNVQHVPTATQNRLLARLAPLRGEVIRR